MSEKLGAEQGQGDASLEALAQALYDGAECNVLDDYKRIIAKWQAEQAYHARGAGRAIERIADGLRKMRDGDRSGMSVQHMLEIAEQVREPGADTGIVAREEALFRAANTAAVNLATSMNLREHPDSCECYGCGLNRAVVNFALARARENVRPIVERELQAERWPGADTVENNRNDTMEYWRSRAITAEQKVLEFHAQIAQLPGADTGTTPERVPSPLFISAVSGLFYENPEAAGDIAAICIDGKNYTLAERGTKPDAQTQYKRFCDEAEVDEEERSIAGLAFEAGWAGGWRARAERGTTPPEGLSEVAFEEVRVMLEEQKTECLADPRYKGLNRMRADELDNALINLRALAATQRAPVEQGREFDFEAIGDAIDRVLAGQRELTLAEQKNLRGIYSKLFTKLKPAPDHAREGALTKGGAALARCTITYDQPEEFPSKVKIFVFGVGTGVVSADALADGKEGGE